jgi:osmotically inducible lipoprotein OsmB
MEVYMQFIPVKSATGKGLLFAIALTFAGCASGDLSTREKSTLGGAALGAGAGALIGEATDHSPGKGALIGGAIGGLGGALVGDSMQSQDSRVTQQQYELDQQRYELERQRRELEDQRRHDDYYRRDPYYEY